MKLLVIMRGVPGSGKSTLAYEISRYQVTAEGNTANMPGSFTCSADYYFEGPKGYRWYSEGLPMAHSQCRRYAEYAMSKDYPLVIIDNTNIKRWMMDFYKNQAKKWGYLVWECAITPDPAMAEIYASRNVHGVTLEHIKKLINQWEN